LEFLLVPRLGAEVNDGTTGMEGIDNLVDEVTGENETAVAMKLFNKCAKRKLNIMSCVVCLINNDNFMFATTRETDS